MKVLWDRMEQWLQKQAPDVLADLLPGASELEIAELEAAIGFTLPADLRESLHIHNGQSGDAQWLIAGWELLSAERILEEWRIWKDLYDKSIFADFDADVQTGIVSTWWQPAWIPLTYDGAGNHHCLDLFPADSGTSGQIISMWHDGAERRILAGSYRQWFEYLVQTYEANDAEFVFESGDFDFEQ
ncbi:SMI1/KNR4 family protein [Paenibacillus solisilvae]|uniref:SMI1/KNR4 family protein n=1 Tax=Paenibacillus solisilvae TaxID=2486751 RepID=A0ABW0W7K8_9BACL